MSRFINTELKPDSESSDSDLDDNELMTKLKKSKSHFANFKQVKKKIVILLNLNKNKLNTKLLWEKPDT